MNVLIAAATEGELGPFNEYMRTAALPGHVGGGIIITGVGMMSTAYELGKHLAKSRYDLVLQVGVGGSYVKSIALGDVVHVTSEQYGDLGAEDHEAYMDIFELGLLGKDTPPYINGRLLTPLLAVHNKIALPQVSGLTINTVSGSERTIAARYNKYHCDVESMEGAALAYVCLKEHVAFAQVRAISNYVIPRDKSQWRMKDAVVNLNQWLTGFMESL